MRRLAKISIIFFSIWVFIPILISTKSSAQTKIKAVALAHAPIINPDSYNQKLKQKSFVTKQNTLIILNQKDENNYTLEYYSNDLKKLWQTPIGLAKGEELEAFSPNEKDAILLTYQKSGANQVITGYRVNLSTGQKSEPLKLFEATAASRRMSTVISLDGTKIVAYQNVYALDQLKSISARLFDGAFNKLKDRIYDLKDLQGIASATVKINNAGEQFVALTINKATKLTVRRYTNATPEIKGMDVQIGGAFEGKNIYVLDTKFELQPDGNLYAAAICADEKTGDYHSLKVVKFDFSGNDMKYAPEFRFTPQYIAALNKALPDQKAIKRLEDISLSDIMVTQDSKVVIIAEKKYNEGPKLPFVAKEMHLFAYDEFMNPTWHSVINKSQTAPATEGFTSISYRAQLFNNNLHILTSETLNGKADIYSRKINILNGVTDTPKPLGLNLTSSQGVTYVKDFTSWLDEKNIITLFKPAKKTSLQLSKITLK